MELRREVVNSVPLHREYAIVFPDNKRFPMAFPLYPQWPNFLPLSLKSGRRQGSWVKLNGFKPGSLQRVAVRSWASHLIAPESSCFSGAFDEDSVRNTHKASILLMVLSEHSRNSTATVTTTVVTVLTQLGHPNRHNGRNPCPFPF